MQLEKESKIATLRDRAGESVRDESDDAVEINFTGQGIYNGPRQGTQGKQKGNFVRTDPLSVMGCFNCDAPDHMEKD